MAPWVFAGIMAEKHTTQSAFWRMRIFGETGSKQSLRFATSRLGRFLAINGLDFPFWLGVCVFLQRPALMAETSGLPESMRRSCPQEVRLPD